MKNSFLAVLVPAFALVVTNTSALAASLSCTGVEVATQKLNIDLLSGHSSISLATADTFDFFSWTSAKSEKLSVNTYSFEFILKGEPTQQNKLTIIKSTVLTRGGGRGGCGRGGCDLPGSNVSISALLQLDGKTTEFDCYE